MAGVDVIVVNYNGGEYLRLCLESVLRSTQTVHLIVVDNGSSDASMAAVESLDWRQHRLSCINNGADLGFAKAVNQAAQLGCGEFICLLSPAAEIYPHTLANLSGTLQARRQAGVLGALVFDAQGLEQGGCRYLEPALGRQSLAVWRLENPLARLNLQAAPLPDKVAAIAAVSATAMLIRRATFAQIAGMDEGYFLDLADLDFCRRVRDAGQQVLFTPQVSLFHHHNPAASRGDYAMQQHRHRGRLRYYNKHQKPKQSKAVAAFSRGVMQLDHALFKVRYGLSRGLERAGLDKSDLNAPSLISLTAGFAGKIIITGASSDLGSAVLRSMQDEPLPVIAVTRGKVPKQRLAQERWLNWDYFTKVPAADLGQITQWLALSPIWSAPSIAKTLSAYAPPARVIAYSSTSIVGKSASRDEAEQQVVGALKQGENALLAWANAHGVALTIARASMIYGGARNSNVNLLKRLVKIARFFPLPAGGKAKRQPVHIADLAAATHQLRRATAMPAVIYNLAGGETLTYKTMLERVFAAAGQPVRFVHVSHSGLCTLAAVLNKLPGLGFVNAALIARMQSDLCYDIEPAVKDFGYSPGEFRP